MAEQDWHYPAPTGLRFSNVSDSGYRLEWHPVTGPQGQRPVSYTVETWQLNGVKIDEFTVTTTSAAQYGPGGKGLHPGWTYRNLIWANGGPKAPPGAEIKVTLKPEEKTAQPATVLPQAFPALVLPPGPPQGVKRAAVAASRAAPATVAGHPAMWQPWQQVITHAEERMRTELKEALREYDHALASAGRILDVAYAEAAEIAGQLQDAAWTAWSKTMASASEASDRIMIPAVRAYDTAVSQAHTVFSKALGTAEQAYKQVLADAGRARSDAPPAA